MRERRDLDLAEPKVCVCKFEFRVSSPPRIGIGANRLSSKVWLDMKEGQGGVLSKASQIPKSGEADLMLMSRACLRSEVALHPQTWA